MSDQTSPRPWKVVDFQGSKVILDANNHLVSLNPENAALVVSAVNAHEGFVASSHAVVEDAYEWSSLTQDERCVFCGGKRGEPHHDECPMVSVEEAIKCAKAWTV